MAGLIIGPLLRWVGERDATIWVETDAPCEVRVLGAHARTFHVAGHHYAIVTVRGLEPGTVVPYEVHLDGERAWPVDGSGFPPSVIRTAAPEGRVRIAFGSCRVAVPHDRPFSLDRALHRYGRGLDALAAFARRLIEDPTAAWPDVLLLLGDQVYADDVPEATRAFLAQRRDLGRSPGEQVADFEEYTRLYRDSWTEPLIRWLLSTVSTSMIFDDHDVIDDWNISAAWVAEMRATDWWEDRITGAFMSYWIHQHLGNLTPDELASDPLLAAVQADDDAAARLRSFAHLADRETAGTRWTYRRDLGEGVRLVVLDSRAARVLDGRRDMLDEPEWAWVEENLAGARHLVVASSLPILLASGFHHVQAWSERVADGAWGARAARLGERVRRALDLEAWASFGASFDRLLRLLAEVGSGRRGAAPDSITLLSGDVHHGYLARVRWRRATGVVTPVYQAVCSPFRNPLKRHERVAQRAAASRVGERLTRALARLAGAPPPIVRWRRLEGLAFDNQIGSLAIDGGEVVLRIERALPGEGAGDPVLGVLWERRLAPAPRRPEVMPADTDGAPADAVDPLAATVPATEPGPSGDPARA
jgi:phosphodiesterase/alkaline phosphatase D-like protein